MEEIVHEKGSTTQNILARGLFICKCMRVQNILVTRKLVVHHVVVVIVLLVRHVLVSPTLSRSLPTPHPFPLVGRQQNGRGRRRSNARARDMRKRS